MDVTEIGNKIKTRRTALNMTQKDLAKEMNVSNQLISKWETGESVPSLEYLNSLCKALNADYSYFISDSENEPVSDEAAKPEKQRKFKFNLKLFLIIASSCLAAALIAVFSVLTVYVFIPSANRTKYLDEIEKSIDDYFSLGYYSINVKSELDGDVENDYRLDGYFDGEGNPVFKDSKTVKDGIVTLWYDTHSFKYHYIADKTYNTIGELAMDRLAAIQNRDTLDDEESLEDIKYIRKVKDGYYLEMSNDFFFDGLDGTQKKNLKLTEKIKGKIEIKDGLFKYMEVTVKYYNKPDNEHFTLKTSLEFIAEKPVIEHENLEKREWAGTYVGDKYYSTYPPSTGDTTPVYEELLSKEEFVSRLSGGKAKKLELDYDFNEKVLDGAIEDGGDCYYYVYGKTVNILNKTDLSLKTTVELVDSSYTHVYNGNVYWKDSGGYFHVKNINSGKTELLFKLNYLVSCKLEYNAGYAIYFNDRDKYYDVIDLTQKRIINSYKDIAYVFLDSEGCVYGEQQINGALVPVVYKDGNRTVLKGKDFYREDSVFDDLYIHGDSIYTRENDKVYRYENGDLKEQLTTSDPRFEENYIKLTNGYCFTNTFTREEVVFDENGTAREFEEFELKKEDGGKVSINKYTNNEIIAVSGDKLIVSLKLGDYMAVYDENDLSKPLYYMKAPKRYDYSTNSLEVRHIGENTVIAVRINSDDYYGYELYYF